MIEFILESDYIELVKLLKKMNLVSTGGEAKMYITEGSVRVNGEPEYRKRAKIRSGDVVQFEDRKIEIK